MKVANEFLVLISRTNFIALKYGMYCALTVIYNCINIGRDIPKQLKDKINENIEPVIAIHLHTEECWKLAGNSLPCPERPDLPADNLEDRHRPPLLVDGCEAHTVLEPDICDDWNADFPIICWFRLQDMFYNLDHPEIY